MCYKNLITIDNNPVAQINYAIALSKWKGPESGLNKLEEIEEKTSKPIKHLFYTAKAAMLLIINNMEKLNPTTRSLMTSQKMRWIRNFCQRKSNCVIEKD